MPTTSDARSKDIWRHRQALLPALAVVALASVALAPAARAAGGSAEAASWRRVPVTQAAFMNSPVASSLQTGDIACLSKSSCVAAGAVFGDRGSARPVLWDWDGQAWSYSAPTDLGSAAFSSSACAGPGDCFAVGATNPFRGITEDPLVVRFNGTRWERVPVGGRSLGVALNGVACLSATLCLAVGDHQTTRATAVAVVYRWNGHVWSLQTTFHPSGSTFSALSAVDCPDAHSCVALGESTPGGKAPGSFFGERFNGSSWSEIHTATARPFTFTGTSWNEISCVNPHSCLAAGQAVLYYAGSQSGALFPGPVFEQWNGSAWTAVPASSSGTALPLLPDGVSCTTSAGCLVALSAGPPQSPFGVPLAYATWTGATFSTPVPLGGDGALEAVACLAAGWCITLGQIARDPQNYKNQHLQVISEVTSAA